MSDVVKKKGWKEIFQDRAGIVIPTDWMHLSTGREEDGEKLYELMEQHGYFKDKKQEE